MNSGVPGKTEKGGQSAARYARIREGMRKEFYRRVAEAVKVNFWDMKKLKGIIVGGPGPTKEYFLKEGQIVTALKEKIMGVKDIGYADEHGLELLVEVSKDLLSDQEITREKKILEDFLTNLAKNPNKTVYGLEDTRKALKVGAVDTLIMDKKIDKHQINELRQMADNISAKVEIVSEETEEGQQFKSLGGVGAILRFDIGLR
jgi:peptide chain release factor subunit 1